MIVIKKNIFFLIKSFFYLLLTLILILFIYAAFFYKSPSIKETQVEEKINEDVIKKTKDTQIKKEPIKEIKEPSKEIKTNDITKLKAVIKDSLFATVGNKAITYSDIVNEMKILLILNNQTFSIE